MRRDGRQLLSSKIKTLFEQVDIAMAPGLGLYLDELFYDQYNAKQRVEMGKKSRSSGSTSVTGSEQVKMGGSAPASASHIHFPVDGDDEGEGEEAASKPSDEVKVAASAPEAEREKEEEKDGPDGDAVNTSTPTALSQSCDFFCCLSIVVMMRCMCQDPLGADCVVGGGAHAHSMRQFPRTSHLAAYPRAGPSLVPVPRPRRSSPPPS